VPSSLQEKRIAAVEAAEETCPRCGAARERGQEYCLECGFRLPTLEGRLPRLRRRWVRRFGWYPGDWIWVSLLTLVVAAGGAAISIWLTTDKSPATTTVVAPAPVPATATRRTTVPSTTARTTKPAKTAKTTSRTPKTTTTSRITTLPAGPKPPPNGKFEWPAHQNGWTLVLISYATSNGRAVPEAAAARAAAAGLPQVGVLDSADYSSLHPGYYVVFSGIYSSQSEAEAALASARAGGFGGAYTREISR
jgi:hypothetical protein